MVTFVPGASSATTKQKKATLRRVLSEADYNTTALDGGSGPENEEARRIVRLIRAATIKANNYPVANNTLLRDDLEVWDDEGGAPRHRP